VDDCQWIFGRPLGQAFLQFRKATFVLKIDGISTEPDTWKGLEILIDLSLLAALKFCAVLVKEIFQSGA
jgi:hypothetical protein